jgi:hypothetical protein
MGVDTTTYLNDAKNVYGKLQEQISTLAALMNLFGNGGKFGKPINEAGIKGWTFGARLTPNFNMGYRPEGTTGVGTAGNQGLKQGTAYLKYAYVPITITGQAENLTKGQARAFMQAKALEAKFDMKDIVSHVNVVFAGAEPGGQLAQVAAAPAPGAGTFTADNAGGLPGALYLRVGMPIDTNAVGGGALTVDSSIISAINYATRAVTHATGTALAGEAVSLADEAALTTGTFPYTADGLVKIVAATGALNGLNPATSGEERWSSFVYDNYGSDLSSQLIQMLLSMVKNRSGENPDCLLFPSAQINQLVGFATTELRFDVASANAVGKRALDLGFTVYQYGGKPIIEDKDLRNDRIFAGASDLMKKFEAIPLSMADDEAGSWTRIIGANGIADATAALLRWYHQFTTLQRSAWGCIKNLSVPDWYLNNPATL